MSALPVYCLSFAGSPRRSRMQERFSAVDVPCIFVEPTSADQVKTEISAQAKDRGIAVPADFHFWATAIMQSHLRMIRTFVEESIATHAVFCEDDVHLRLTLANDLPRIVEAFDRMSLDVMLLGYLWPYRQNPPEASFAFHDYPDDLWGAQMYMLSRSRARQILESHELSHALERRPAPFASDWTITKDGRRARVVPMLAVEEGGTVTSHDGQVDFHRRCFEAQYDAEHYTSLSIGEKPS